MTTVQHNAVSITSGPCWCNGDTTTGGHWHGSATGTDVPELPVTVEAQLNLPYRWCFAHNDMVCDHPHDDSIADHCFGIDESEDYSKCDVRDATVSPKEGDNG